MRAPTRCQCHAPTLTLTLPPELQLTERFVLTMPDFGFNAAAVHKEMRDVYAEAKAISADEQRVVSQAIFTFYERWARLLSGDLLTRTMLGAVPFVDDLFSDMQHDLATRLLSLSRTHNTTPRPVLPTHRSFNVSIMSILSFSSADAARVRFPFPAHVDR